LNNTHDSPEGGKKTASAPQQSENLRASIEKPPTAMNATPLQAGACPPDFLSVNNKLIKQIVGRYIFPGIMAQLGVKIGSVINTVIIGQFYGTDGLALMSLLSPLELIMMSVGSLICVSAAVYAGYAAAKNKDFSDWYSAAFWAVIIAGAVISVFGIIFAGNLATLFGANENQHAALSAAIRAMLFGGVFMTSVYLPLNFLKVIGRPRIAMNILFIMSGVNIVFAYIFAAIMGMGVAGAMLGTAVSYTAAFIYGQFAFHKYGADVKILPPKAFKEFFKGKLKALPSGVPSALNNILRAVLALCVNLLIINFIPKNAPEMMSAVAILNSVMSIINAFVFGISQSTLQIAGIAYSERDYKTVKAALRNIFIIGNIAVGILAALILIFRAHIGAIFGISDSQYSALALTFAGCYANLYLSNNIMTNFFSAVRRNLPAIVIVSLRLSLFMLVPAFFLCVFGLTDFAIWVGYFAAEFIAFGAIIAYTALKRRKNPNLSRLLLLDDEAIRDIKALDFSVPGNIEAGAEASERISLFLEETDLPPKSIMRISMAVEEIVALVCSHAALKINEFIDIRIIKKTDEALFMRLRYGGRDFNPVKYCYQHFDDDDSDAFGMNLVLKLTNDVTYNRLLGVNNLILEI
jgi:Na+-driven multidrug efflux pump/anti-sigma regulatory factor (Ser/Thr protein kinase)